MRGDIFSLKIIFINFFSQYNLPSLQHRLVQYKLKKEEKKIKQIDNHTVRDNMARYVLFPVVNCHNRAIECHQ